MFSKEQIVFMESLGLNIDFANLSEDDFMKIEDLVSCKLQKSGFDENENITSDGRMCESILDELT